jgi:hypothetical protein
MSLQQVFAADLVALIVLLAIVRVLARPRQDALTAYMTRMHPDFGTAGLIISRDGKSALAIDDRGNEAILVFLLGTRWVSWRLPAARLKPPYARYHRATDSLAVDTGDVTRRTVTLALPADEKLAEFFRIDEPLLARAS